MATSNARQNSPTAIQVKNEFKTYWASAEKNRLTNPASQRTLIASAHKYAMCFSYFARSMGSLPEHQRIFFQELTSDAVHLVHALVGGDARGARFYLRSVIENFWRHHYFRDHLVEYGWLHSRDKYYHEMKNLREHCGWLDCFQGRLKSLMTNLPRLYSELSTSVHSTSSKTVVLRQTLADIRLVEEQTKAITKDVLDVLKVCLALCIFSEKEVFLALHVNVQHYLMDSVNSAQRTAILAAFTESGSPYPLE